METSGDQGGEQDGEQRKKWEHSQWTVQKKHSAPVLHVQRQDVRWGWGVLGRGRVVTERLRQLQQPLRELAVQPREFRRAVHRGLD